jgi:MFS transporter, DHA3 family, macrolide efflux protein
MSTESQTEYQPPANGFRTFLIMWVTQSLSVFGSALTWFAVVIWLTQTRFPLDSQKPELAFALTAISLTYIITLALAPIAGAWVDRHDRKLTMLAVDLGNGVLTLVLMMLMLTNTLDVWMLVILMVFFQALGPFHHSAFDTSYAMIVPEKHLPRANGMMQTMWSLSGILSPALAATIIALPALARQGLLPGALGDWLAPLTNGAALAIGLDAITFFIAAFALLFLYVPSPKRTDLRAADGTKIKKSMWADIKEGALYIRRRPPLLWLLATFTVVNFASAPVELFVPLLLKFNLAGDWERLGFTFETALALITTLGSIGGVVGGVIMSTWGGLKRKRVYGVVIPIMVGGVLQVIYGMSPSIILSAAMSFAIVSLIPVLNAHSQTIWQTQVPRELQGRVFAVRRVIAQFSQPVGTLLAGLASATFNPGAIIAVLGGITVIFCIIQLFNPYLLRVEDKQYLDEVAIRRGEPIASLTPDPQQPQTLAEEKAI